MDIMDVDTIKLVADAMLKHSRQLEYMLSREKGFFSSERLDELIDALIPTLVEKPHGWVEAHVVNMVAHFDEEWLCASTVSIVLECLPRQAIDALDRAFEARGES